jgi:hypothetical protein
LKQRSNQPIGVHQPWVEMKLSFLVCLGLLFINGLLLFFLMVVLSCTILITIPASTTLRKAFKLILHDGLKIGPKTPILFQIVSHLNPLAKV